MTSAPSTTSPSWVADEVEDDEVAVGGGALDVVEGAEALAQRLDLLVDVVVGDLDVVDGRPRGRCSRAGRSRADVDLGGELERLVVLELGDLDLRLGERPRGRWPAAPRRTSAAATSLIASSSTAPRPTWRSMTIGGTLPRRKPGTLICWAIFLYAASRLGLSSSKGTSTVSLARVGLKVSTALFTGCLLSSAGPIGRRDGAGCVLGVGATGLEPAISCSQSRRASHYATPRYGCDDVPLLYADASAASNRPHAGVAQWQSPSLPSWPCRFDPGHPLHLPDLR